MALPMPSHTSKTPALTFVQKVEAALTRTSRKTKNDQRRRQSSQEIIPQQIHHFTCAAIEHGLDPEQYIADPNGLNTWHPEVYHRGYLTVVEQRRDVERHCCGEHHHQVRPYLESKAYPVALRTVYKYNTSRFIFASVSTGSSWLLVYFSAGLFIR